VTSLIFPYAGRAARNAGDRLHGLEHCTFGFRVLKTPRGAIVKRLKRNFAAFAILSLVASLLGGLASAHHGTGVAYETDKSVTLKGTVTEWIWSNPHCGILFDVTDDQGNVAHWGAELGNPHLLSTAGFSKDVMKPGDKVTVTGHPSRSGAPRLEFVTMTLADGKVLTSKGVKGNGERADTDYQ
jgi:hypothetical protein